MAAVRVFDGTVRYGVVWYGMVWNGLAWYGMVWYGMVWYGMVWYGIWAMALCFFAAYFTSPVLVNDRIRFRRIFGLI